MIYRFTWYILAQSLRVQQEECLGKVQVVNRGKVQVVNSSSQYNIKLRNKNNEVRMIVSHQE